jgi:hypothetical protein
VVSGLVGIALCGIANGGRRIPAEEAQLTEGKHLYAKLSEHLSPSTAAKLAAEISGAPRTAAEYLGRRPRIGGHGLVT